MEVLLEFEVKHCWAYLISKYVISINIIDYEIDWKRGVVTDISEVYLKEGAPIKEVIDEMIKISNVIEAKVLKANGNVLLLKVVSKACPLYYLLKNEAVSSIKENIKVNGEIEFRIRIKRRRKIKSILDKIKSDIEDIRVKNVKMYTHKYKLTKRQEAIIKAALDLGFYDYPKKITLQELSKILKISAPVLNEILRRGEKNVIKYFFELKRIHIRGHHYNSK